MAQAKYPVPTVTLATHSSAGGGSDVFLRELVKHVQPIIGANLAVSNITGGSGARAMAELAKSPANGSIFYATTPTFIYTSLLSKPTATYRDLEPLVNVFYDPEVLYTAADGPYKTLQDVINAAKAGRGKWGATNPASHPALLDELAREFVKSKDDLRHMIRLVMNQPEQFRNSLFSFWHGRDTTKKPQVCQES